MLQQALKYFLAACFIINGSFHAIAQTDSLKKSGLSFDLGITRGRNINIWPLFKKYRSEEKKELQIIYPLFSKRINYNNNTRHLQVLPFYIRDSSSKGTHTRFLSLYYPSLLRIYKKTDSSGVSRAFHFLELAPHISLFGFNRSASGFSVENNIFFFIFYRKDAMLEKTRFVIFPAYWYFANKTTTTQLLFPFYFTKKSPEKNYLNIAFLYNQKKSQIEKKHALIPLWWHSTHYYKTDTIRKDLILPLYWHKQSNYERRTVLFPLLYTIKRQDYRSFTFFPLYSSGRDDRLGRNYFAVTPLFWHQQSPSGIKNIFFPLYWNLKTYGTQDTIKREILFPLLWTLQSKTRNNTVVFPVLFKFDEPDWESLTLFPLFHRYKSFKTGDELKAITPFYWESKTKTERRRVLFPVYWNTEVYLKEDTVRRHTIFPVYWHVKTKGSSTHVVFPILYSFRGPRFRSLTVFPFYSAGRSIDGLVNYIVVTPLFWRVQTRFGTTRALLPFYWNSIRFRGNGADTIRRHGIFPIYWAVKGKEKNNHIVFPFVYSINTTKQKSLTIFPLFSYGAYRDGSRRHIGLTPFLWHLKYENGVTNLFFPIYWNIRQYDPWTKDTTVRHRLFPLIWITKSKERNNSVFFPLVFSLKNKERRSFTFFPLFSFGKTNHLSRHLVITPLFWRFQNKSNITGVLFPFYLRRTIYHDHDTVNKRILFPLYWSFKNGQGKNSVLFPLVYHFKNDERRSFTFFPLFSFGKRRDPFFSHLAVTPLFWHIRNRGFTRTVLFPLYWKKGTITRRHTQ